MMTSGTWKPKDLSGLSFGNQGFYLKFDNAASLGADSSGNGKNVTLNNITSLDQATDTPTNNFCVLNAAFSDNYTAAVRFRRWVLIWQEMVKTISHLLLVQWV